MPSGLWQRRVPKEALGRGVGTVGWCCRWGVLFRRSFGRRRKGRGRGGVGREIPRRRRSWFMSILLHYGVDWEDGTLYSPRPPALAILRPTPTLQLSTAQYNGIYS